VGIPSSGALNISACAAVELVLAPTTTAFRLKLDHQHVREFRVLEGESLKPWVDTLCQYISSHQGWLSAAVVSPSTPAAALSWLRSWYSLSAGVLKWTPEYDADFHPAPVTSAPAPVVQLPPPPPPPPPTATTAATGAKSLFSSALLSSIREAGSSKENLLSPTAPSLPLPSPRKNALANRTGAGMGNLGLLAQIKKGTQLRAATIQSSAKSSFTFTPFNIEKIVQRRSAIEMSDDDTAAGSGDEWSSDD
jgi:hypothetical protein